MLAAMTLILAGCSTSPFDLPLPGGANLGDDPYEVTVEFRDVLDLVPQSAVRVDDIAVGKVTDIKLKGWTAVVTLEVNQDAKLPANAVANLRQSSLLGEKFVSLEAPKKNPSKKLLADGAHIGLDRSGRNSEIEEVLGAASLLFNGGGLERTNTIVKELNRTLDGNEPEIKQLLRSSELFLGQLDDNKEELLAALEKVNNLAKATQAQEGTITEALDELPEAMEVLDEQRDELVGLLKALERLGDVATGVIRRSKDDTLAVLRDLDPTLKNLADTGDDLATSMRALLSFPFSDAITGNSVAVAMEPCPEQAPGGRGLYDSACFGDYANLDVRLELDTEQVRNLLGGVLGTFGSGSDGSPSSRSRTGAREPAAKDDADSPEPDRMLDDLLGSKPASGEGEDSAPDSGESNGGGFCGLLGMCRTSTTGISPAELMESSDDLGRLVLGPAVAQ